MQISRDKIFSVFKELNLAAMENREAWLPVSEKEFEYMRESIQSSVFVGVFIENVLGDWWNEFKDKLHFDNTHAIYKGHVLFFSESEQYGGVTIQSLVKDHGLIVPNTHLSDDTDLEHDYCYPYLMLVNMSTKSIMFHPSVDAYLAECNRLLEETEDAV